jgi:hypothetical protein
VRFAALALALAAGVVSAPVASPAAARSSPQPMFETFKVLEVEVRADFNRDGHADVAYIVRDEDRRELRVATSVVTDGAIGEAPLQVLALDSDPLGPAQLTVKDNVLLLQELTGGTTAVFSTHRFRWDARLAAMRLIGLDATLYSRTFAHDGQAASWNLLTGLLLTHTMRLRKDDSDIAYDEVDKRRKRKPSPPLRLEQSPSGDDLLGWPGGQ